MQPALDRKLSHRSLGILGVSAATTAWGFVPLILKQTTLHPLAFASWRLSFGALVFGLVLVATGRRLRWSTIRSCALGGVLFGLDVSLGFAAFQATSVANATIIGALAPVFIALGAARWFGERFERRDAWFILASFAGVGLVAAGSAGSASWSLFGDVLAGLGTISWTAYWLFSKHARRDATTLEYMATVMLVAAVVVTATTAISGVPLAPPEGIDWLWIWIVVLIPGATGHMLVAWSHRHVEAWITSLITQGQAVVASIAAWVLLNEALTPLTIAGGAVVLGATAAIGVRESRRQPDRIEPLSADPAG